MIRLKPFFLGKTLVWMHIWVKVSESGVWCGHISALLMHRQPLHLLDLKPAGEGPSLSKDFLSPSAARLSRGHAGTQWHVWIWRAIAAAASWNGPADDFIQYLTSWGGLSESQDRTGSKTKEKKTENSFDILQSRLAKIPDITFFKPLSWPRFCYGFIIRISSLCLFNPQLLKAQPAGL